MKNENLKVKKKKKKASSEDLKQLKEQQQLIYLRQRRKQRKKQMVFHRIRALLRFSTVMAIMLTFLYFIMLPQWKLSPLTFSSYPNKNLVFEDNLITSDSQIINELKKIKLPNKPLFFVNPKIFETALLKLDPVKKVYVRRYWLPTRLNFVIVEKNPLFLVHRGLNTLPLYAVTNEGDTIGNQYLPLPEQYEKQMFHIVLPSGNYKWTKDLVDKYYSIAKIAEICTKEQINYLDMTNPKDVYIRLNTINIRIGEIDANVVERISRLKAIMPKVSPMENRIDYIDLRWDKAIVVKEKVSKEIIAEQTKERQKKLSEEKAREASRVTVATPQTQAATPPTDSAASQTTQQNAQSNSTNQNVPAKINTTHQEQNNTATPDQNTR